MKVYIDVVLIINFIFDFILLLSTSIVLKRNVKIYKIILGSLFGSLTILLLFFRISSFTLFIIKFLISIFMILITFNYINLRYFLRNLYYFYIISIFLGGFLYFINNQFSYSNNNLIFINNGFKLNIFLGIILGIIGITIYIKNIKKLKTNYNKYYLVDIYYDNKKITLNAFLDTGNKLFSPYNNNPIILVNKDKIITKENDFIYVPFNTVNNSGLLKCVKAEKIYIEKIGYKKKFLIGLSDSIKIDGVDVILNEKLLEG